MGYILGIDTSNYKTSIAVIDHKKHIICDLRRFLTVKQGERGLRQSDALFQHIQNLPELMEEMRRMFDGRIDAVACSFRPRRKQDPICRCFWQEADLQRRPPLR